jgi:hypothetical protein
MCLLAEKDVLLEVCQMILLPEGSLGKSGNERLWQEHGNGQVGTWKACFDCGHMPLKAHRDTLSRGK